MIRSLTVLLASSFSFVAQASQPVTSAHVNVTDVVYPLAENVDRVIQECRDTFRSFSDGYSHSEITCDIVVPIVPVPGVLLPELSVSTVRTSEFSNGKTQFSFADANFDGKMRIRILPASTDRGVAFYLYEADLRLAIQQTPVILRAYYAE